MNLKVSHHIAQCTKHLQKQNKFHIFPIYKIKVDNSKTRKHMEQHFIKLLKPDLNA